MKEAFLQIYSFKTKWGLIDLVKFQIPAHYAHPIDYNPLVTNLRKVQASNSGDMNFESTKMFKITILGRPKGEKFSFFHINNDQHIEAIATV